MAFSRYPKLEQLRRLEDDLLSKEVVVLEKIHGSNGSICIHQDGSYQVGKRSGFLEPGDKFCSGHKLVERYKDQLMSIFKDLIEEDGSYLRVYGEFYGGLYNCRTSEGSVKVQRMVDYSPDNEFAIFDIVIEGNRQNVLSWDRVKDICDKYGMPRVPEICRGRWCDIKKSGFDVESLISRVPFELHQLREVENPRCEGVVIRHDDGEWGLRCKLKQRWMDDVPEPKAKKNDNPDSEVRDECMLYMNQARFISYMSKIGVDDIMDKRKMGDNIRALVEDSIEDIISNKMIRDERFLKSLKKGLSNGARRLIVNYWNGID